MKKTICSIFLLAAVLMSCMSAAAQGRGMDRLYGEFSGKEGYTSVTYGSRMLRMMKEGGSKQLQDLLDNIEVIRVISTVGFCDELETSAKCAVVKDSYELISEVREGDRCNAFYFKDEPSGNSSFLMIAADGRSVTVLDIYGRFEVNEISMLAVVPGRVLGEGKNIK